EIFDPGSAAQAGIDLRRLLWVRCGSDREVALRAADMLVRCPGFALVALDLGERVPRLPTTAAFRLKFAVRRTDVALLIVGRRRLTGSSAALAVETLREGIEWAGPGPAPSRLARVRTTTRVLRALRRMLRTRLRVEEYVASARHALLEAALAVSPRIEDGGAGLAYVETVGLERLIGDPAAIGRRLVHQVRAIGLIPRVALAAS